MIKKYLDFINESLEMILESNVVYSKNFKTVISKIEHPLAKAILDIENTDFPVRNNYFDVNFKENDKLGFIPDRKAQEILNDPKNYVNYLGGSGWLKHKETNQNLFNKLGYSYEEGVEPYNAPTNEVGEVITEVKSEISSKEYAWVKFPGGQGVYNKEKLRTVDNKEKALWSRGRQDIFVGRGIRALLTTAGIKFVDKDLEEFVNLYKSTVDKMNDVFQYFDVVKGGDIAHWYSYGNYEDRIGTLGSSCMSNVDDYYFDIYVSNPDVCQLVILKSKDDDSKIIGRALLWTLIDGKKFMDRIYTMRDSDVQIFRDYAKENGWFAKYHNNSTDSGSVITPTGSQENLGKLTVNIRKGMYDGYPYLDTLKYFDPSGTLSNKTGTNTYLLESTDGDLGDGCDYCNGSGRTECSNCDGDGSWECGDCSGSGDSKCPDCSGTGATGDGESCGSCDNGKVDCDNCDGSGKEYCDDCDGDGMHDCYECN
jgi:hypothetical protein